MTWIKTIPPEGAADALADAYALVAAATGVVPNVLQAQSLSPSTLTAHQALARELLFGRGPLTRAQRELVAVVVSQTNGCHY